MNAEMEIAKLSGKARMHLQRASVAADIDDFSETLSECRAAEVALADLVILTLQEKVTLDE